MAITPPSYLSHFGLSYRSTIHTDLAHRIGRLTQITLRQADLLVSDIYQPFLSITFVVRHADTFPSKYRNRQPAHRQPTVVETSASSHILATQHGYLGFAKYQHKQSAHHKQTVPVQPEQRNRSLAT
ncbi:hypothetical [Yersinia pestis KIM10+]|uniref:Uncharacterized protein n=1 Tax=Yersinia pestis TaxID=632 RepID=Q8CL74_YERPE|nr:hypothetical [Yersinia pestis KIM10+]